MKKINLFLTLLFLTTGLFAMPDMFNKDGVLHFDYKAEDLAPAEAAARARLEKELADIIAIPKEQRTFENTIMGYLRAFNHYGIGISWFLAYVSPDKNFRDAIHEMNVKMNQYMIDVDARRDIYQAIREYTDTNPQLGPVEAKLVKEMLIGFKNSGLELSDEELETFKKLNKEEAEYATKFRKNVQEYKDPLAVTKEQLKGLGEDYISKLQKTDDGKYLVTLDYPDYIPFMQNADDEQARKELEYKYHRRGGQENVELLEKTVTLRREIAHLLGYPTHADLKLEKRMAKNPKNVMKFLKDLEKKLKPLGKQENKQMIAYKNEKTGKKSRTLYQYELDYWSNKYRKEYLDMDDEKIKEYFPSQVVIDGMFSLFGNLLGITVEPADIPSWHPDVKAFAIKDKADGHLIAYFYMDLYPREGKYKHVMTCEIVRGEEKEDGTWQIPFVAIVANMNKPSATTPSLLKHSEVVSLFHEFGHVLHAALTKSKYRAFSGTNVSWDFVEAPSQLLERWAWNPQVLKKISKHYKTGAPLPDDLINKMVAAKNFGAVGVSLRQNFFAQYDMTLHTLPKTPDSTTLYADLMKKIRALPLTKSTYPQAAFEHSMGKYDAGYYGYLWSEVIAEDFFSEFEKNGIFDTKTGLKYRREILEKGGTEEEEKLVENFLGRPADNGPFLKSIGLK